MATIHFYDAQRRETAKYTPRCSYVLITAVDPAGQQIRKKFSRARCGDKLREAAEAYYARLLSEKAGIIGAIDEKGVKLRNMQTQTFEWLARKYVNEHLVPHTRSGDNKYYIETLIIKWGKHRLHQISGPLFRRWIWHALDNAIPTGAGTERIYAPKSINHLITWARRVYNWGISEGLIAKNPLSSVLKDDPALCRELRRRKAARRHEKIATLTAAEFWSFMSWPGLRPCVRRAAILSAYGGGMREGEVCGLRWKQINGNRIRFSAADVKETDDKTVYLEQEAVDILREIEIEQITAGGSGEYVLLNERGLPISVDALSHSWLDYRRAFAKHSQNDKYLKVSFHRLRNTYRTRKAMETDDIHAIAANMGHHEMSTSFLYDVVDDARMQRLTGFENERAERLRNPLEELLKTAREKGVGLEEIQSQLRIMYRDAQKQRAI